MKTNNKFLKETSKYSDNELVAMLCDKKDKADFAFRVIYERYSSKVYAFCRKMLNEKDLAEDVFQETFIKFYKHFDKNKLNNNIVSFLLTIARNLCFNQNRDKKVNIPCEEYHLILDESESYETKELAQIIKAGIDLLEPKYKEPLILRIYNGLSYDTIAEICEINESAARKRVFRAKEKIKSQFEPYFKDLTKKKINY